MAEHVELTYRFRYPWEYVARAYLAKYPHKKLSHVDSVDTLERYVDDQGRLVTSRIMVSSLAGLTNLVGYEKSWVDRSKNSILTFTKNMTHRGWCKSFETCQYVSNDEKSTDYTFEVDMRPAYGVGFFLKLILSTIKSNFYLGTNVVEDIIVKQMGQPRFLTIQDFTDKWASLEQHKQKLKVLKQATRETEIVKFADCSLIRDIMKVLIKCKKETELIASYLQTDWHWKDAIKNLLDEEDKIVIRMLINSMKEHGLVLNYEELFKKYGINQ